MNVLRGEGIFKTSRVVRLSDVQLRASPSSPRHLPFRRVEFMHAQFGPDWAPVGSPDCGPDRPIMNEEQADGLKVSESISHIQLC